MPLSCEACLRSTSKAQGYWYVGGKRCGISVSSPTEKPSQKNMPTAHDRHHRATVISAPVWVWTPKHQLKTQEQALEPSHEVARAMSLANAKMMEANRKLLGRLTRRQLELEAKSREQFAEINRLEAEV